MMKLKFCGFTSIEDVTAASQLPIDAIGFIHYEKVKASNNCPNSKVSVCCSKSY